VATTAPVDSTGTTGCRGHRRSGRSSQADHDERSLRFTGGTRMGARPGAKGPQSLAPDPAGAPSLVLTHPERPRLLGLPVHGSEVVRATFSSRP
jgi:hypothetical protein